MSDPLRLWRRADGTVDWANVPPGVKVGLEYAPLVPFHNTPPAVVAYLVPGAWESSFLIDPRFGTTIPHLSSMYWYVRTGTLVATFSSAVTAEGVEDLEDYLRPRIQLEQSWFTSQKTLDVRVYDRWRLDKTKEPFVPDANGDAPGLFWWGHDSLPKAYHFQWERRYLKPLPSEDL